MSRAVAHESAIRIRTLFSVPPRVLLNLTGHFPVRLRNFVLVLDSPRLLCQDRGREPFASLTEDEDDYDGWRLRADSDLLTSPENELALFSHRVAADARTIVTVHGEPRRACPGGEQGGSCKTSP